MNNLNLLNTLLEAVYWLWEMIKDVLSLIFVLPVRILRSALTMHTRDAIAFIKSDIHHYLNRMKVYGLTFQIKVINGKLKTSVRSYYEEADLLAGEVNRKRHSSTRSIIEESLQMVKKCLFVILEVNDNGMKFIQYRIDGNTYLLDFPLTPLTLNRDYSTEVLQVLLQHGFTKEHLVNGYAYRYKTYNIYALEDELTTVNANFGTDKQLAVEVGNTIFKNIFHSNQIPTVKFG